MDNIISFRAAASTRTKSPVRSAEDRIDRAMNALALAKQSRDKDAIRAARTELFNAKNNFASIAVAHE
jgi:hypothetical protein